MPRLPLLSPRQVSSVRDNNPAMPLTQHYDMTAGDVASVSCQPRLVRSLISARTSTTMVAKVVQMNKHKMKIDLTTEELIILMTDEEEEHDAPDQEMKMFTEDGPNDPTQDQTPPKDDTSLAEGP